MDLETGAHWHDLPKELGDEYADSAAKKKLAAAFSNNVIEQIAIDGIASGGGSIHCATQQEPKV